MLAIGRSIEQATRFLLSPVLSPTRLCKLILEEGNLLDKTFCIFMSNA
jgi:hypothetical protein